MIRSLASHDAVALADLYRRLPAAERLSHVGVCDGHDRGFAARVASVAGRGGQGIIAELGALSPDVEDGRSADDQIREVEGEATGRTASRMAGGAGSVVGEAHFEPLAGGDCALTLVVVREWRDWLGPRLFDAVRDDAAASGVANLQIDVMHSDDWLGGVLSASGHVIVPTDDWLSTRVVVSTSGDMPVWDAAPRPRVIVEASGGRWHAAAAARAAGMTVRVCAGPGAPGTRCPMAQGTPCPLVTDADVVVVSYPSDRPDWDELMATHRRLHPDVPVVVEGRAGQSVADGVVALEVHDPTAVVQDICDLVWSRSRGRADRSTE